MKTQYRINSLIRCLLLLHTQHSTTSIYTCTLVLPTEILQVDCPLQPHWGGANPPRPPLLLFDFHLLLENDWVECPAYVYYERKTSTINRHRQYTGMLANVKFICTIRNRKKSEPLGNVNCLEFVSTYTDSDLASARHFRHWRLIFESDEYFPYPICHLNFKKIVEKYL
jgi:hypothetical protein